MLRKLSIENQTFKIRTFLASSGRRAGPIAWLVQLLYRNMQRFRGGLVFKTHRLVYYSTLGRRVIKKKREAEWRVQTRRRGGLVFEAYRLLYHSTLGLRVIKKKKKTRGNVADTEQVPAGLTPNFSLPLSSSLSPSLVLAL